MISNEELDLLESNPKYLEMLVIQLEIGLMYVEEISRLMPFLDDSTNDRVLLKLRWNQQLAKMKGLVNDLQNPV